MRFPGIARYKNVDGAEVRHRVRQQTAENPFSFKRKAAGSLKERQRMSEEPVALLRYREQGTQPVIELEHCENFVPASIAIARLSAMRGWK